MIDKIYVIGSLRNPEIPEVSRVLRDTLPGVEVFDDWYAAGPEADDYLKRWAEQQELTYEEALRTHAAKHIYHFDKYHLDEADAAVMVYPCGRSCGLEFGYVIGQGKPGWVLLDKPDRWDIMVQFATGWSFSINDIAKEIKHESSN